MNRYWLLLAVASAAVFVLLAVMAARVETPTIDEFAHVPAGCVYWTQQRFDLYMKNPPLMKMAMAVPPLLAGAVVPGLRRSQDAWTPWLYGYEFMVANSARYFTLFWLARMVSILAALLTGGILFLWVREVLGVRPAAITAALFYLNPNILAHGHLATVDAGCMFTVLLALYALHWAYRRRAVWRIMLAGLAWGVALLTKFSSVLLLAPLLVMIALYCRKAWKSAAIDAVCLLAVACLVVNLGMGFKGSFKPWGDYRPASSFGSTMQRNLPDWLLVPLPVDWVNGFDLQKLDAEQGEFGNYLFGEWSDHGWWYYNLVALVVKSPLTLLALAVVCPWFWRGVKAGRVAVVEAALPLGVLLAGMMLFNHLNIGVRYLLPIFPFLLILTAAVWRGRQRWQPWVAGVVLLSHAAVAIWIYPAYLSYFNLAAGGPAQGHRVLLDSNVDWGQDLYRLPAALRKLGVNGKIGLLYFGHVQPQMYGIQYELAPATPAEGVFAVSVQYLMGGSYVATTPDGRFTPVEAGHAAWLRGYEPVARAGSIWIYDTRGKLRPSAPP